MLQGIPAQNTMVTKHQDKMYSTSGTQGVQIRSSTKPMLNNRYFGLQNILTRRLRTNRH